MKCTNPLCLWYHETESPKKAVCDFYDFDITYKNQEKIDNCNHHQTLEQNRIKWKNLLDISLN